VEGGRGDSSVQLSDAEQQAVDSGMQTLFFFTREKNRESALMVLGTINSLGSKITSIVSEGS
jgi:hypothetical protein